MLRCKTQERGKEDAKWCTCRTISDLQAERRCSVTQRAPEKRTENATKEKK